MEKRLIIAVALSILILVAFQHFTPKPPEKPGPLSVGEQSIQKPIAQVVMATLPAERLTTEENETILESDRYAVTFSNIGGAIKNIKLKRYSGHGSDQPLELVAIKNPKHYIGSLSSSDSDVPLDVSPYRVERIDGALICQLRTKNLEITKKYILSKDKYGIDLQLIIKNLSPDSKEFDYRIIGGAGVAEPAEQDKRFVEVTSNVNGKYIGFKQPKSGRITNVGIVGWSALKNKYFSVIVKPFVNTKNQFYSADSDGGYVMGIEPAIATIGAGSAIEHRYSVYVGPSHITTLKEFGHGLDESIDYGFFGVISKFLIVVMGFFYSLVHSWGFSIILLSVFLNLVTFPLTMKSFQSMRKMQELHPQMEKLKAQYKDNAQKLNKEIMELYKTYKINPFSGCLPMLLQMPIFIALYQALMKSIELRNAKFMWIGDLSMPDAVKLPFALPLLGDSINILPLVMVGAMVVQQKISTKSMGGAVTEEQKQQQKLMLIIMPIMFGFIFYNMPSGLVLYWVINTALTIVEQASLFRKD